LAKLGYIANSDKDNKGDTSNAKIFRQEEIHALDSRIKERTPRLSGRPALSSFELRGQHRCCLLPNVSKIKTFIICSFGIHPKTALMWSPFCSRWGCWRMLGKENAAWPAMLARIFYAH
jgi:hypothetical protein